jgi:hypothetical protein
MNGLFFHILGRSHQSDPDQSDCCFQPVSPLLLVESGFLCGEMWLNHVKSTFLLVKSLFYWLNPHRAGRIKKPRPVPRLGQHRFAAREFLDPKAGWRHLSLGIWKFPKMGLPQYEWFTMQNPIQLDELGVPPF